MVINDFNVIGVAVAPYKANTPLIVDADTVLSFPVAFKGFQTIARGRRQIAKFRGDIQFPELTLRDPLKGPKSLDPLPVMELLRLLRPKGLDHIISIYREPVNVKRYMES